jgi:hypothetical protein
VPSWVSKSYSSPKVRPLRHVSQSRETAPFRMCSVTAGSLASPLVSSTSLTRDTVWLLSSPPSEFSKRVTSHEEDINSQHMGQVNVAIHMVCVPLILLTGLMLVSGLLCAACVPRIDGKQILESQYSMRLTIPKSLSRHQIPQTLRCLQLSSFPPSL